MNEAMEQMALRSPAPARPGRWWRCLTRRWRAISQDWKTRRALENLDDRMLRDIGVERSDIATGAYRLNRDLDGRDFQRWRDR